jgi:hypothetical protein
MSGPTGDDTVKLPKLVTVPPRVLTVIGPEAAAVGTKAVICVGELMVYDALVPLKVTLVVESKFVPVMVRPVATKPLGGEKLMDPGAAGA